MADKTTTWGLEIKARSDLSKASDEIANLQESLLTSQNAIKRYTAALRNLKGNSADVVAAKEK